jgi:pyrroline-5-carboxylate reductase
VSGPAPSIAVVGAGKMGSALLAGLGRGEKLGRVLVIEPNPAPDVVELCRAKNFALFARVESSDAPVDALVLAIKPQMLEAAAPALLPLVGPDTLVLSILAGKRVADLASRLPARAFVRAMPNTPAAVGRGVTGAYPSPGVEPGQRLPGAGAAVRRGLGRMGRDRGIDRRGDGDFRLRPRLCVLSRRMSGRGGRRGGPAG